MTSKSFSSKGLLGNSMRRSLWALVLSGVGFFLSLLLPALMAAQRALENRTDWLANLPQADVAFNWQQAMNTVAAMLGGDNPFVKAAFLVLAVVCGVAMFAYLHSRQKVDFYHSLPVSRTRLFANNFMTGAACTFSTYFVMLAVTLACICAMGCGEAVRWDEIGGAVLCNLIVFLLVYALTVLTTIVCGNTVITLLLLAWVFFSPMLVRALQLYLFEKFYDTFIFRDMADGFSSAISLSPVVKYFALDGARYNDLGLVSADAAGQPAPGLLAGYLIAAAAVTALALFLFRRRRSERAGTALAFFPARVPVKVFMCLTMGVAFGCVFGLIAGDFWFWPGLVIGAVLFHWVVEIIYAFDFRAIFAKPLHLVAILAVLAAGMLAMQFDVTGYDTWLPGRDSLTAAAIGRNGLQEAENIDAVYRLAEIGVQYTQEKKGGTAQDNSCFGAELYFWRGSRTDARWYLLPYTDEVRELLIQLQSSEEYKRTRMKLFAYETQPDDGRAAVLEFTDGTGNFMGQLREDPEQIAQIVEALREETLTQSVSAIPVIEIRLMYLDPQNGNTSYFGEAYVTNENSRTLALIEQATGKQPETLSPEQVEHVQIGYALENWEWTTVTVTDPADIGALLENAVIDDVIRLYNGLYEPYGDASGVLTEPMGNVYVNACMDDEEQWGLLYTLGMLPVDILEKYMPENALFGQDDGGQNTAARTAEAAS